MKLSVRVCGWLYSRTAATTTTKGLGSVTTMCEIIYKNSAKIKIFLHLKSQNVVVWFTVSAV